MAINTWKKEEILFIHEDENFLVQVLENDDLVFWELIDTRFVGESDVELEAAILQEIHPTEQTLLVQESTGYTKLYRKTMKVEILGSMRASFLRTILPAA